MDLIKKKEELRKLTEGEGEKTVQKQIKYKYLNKYNS